METEGQRLVELAQRGDRAAAVELIELFYQRIYAFLRRLTGNEEDAADLTQRTFTRMWQALPGFAGRSTVSSWIHSIAYHAYVDWRRKDHRTEPRTNEWWASCVAAGERPDEQAVRSDLSGTLFASVEQLEEELRQTVQLHYYQELTLEETANALGVAASTIKYRLRKAVAELQKLMASEPAKMKLNIAAL